MRTLHKNQPILDHIAWIEHIQYVLSICDSVETAMTAFNIFKRSASAERGRSVIVQVNEVNA